MIRVDCGAMRGEGSSLFADPRAFCALGVCFLSGLSLIKECFVSQENEDIFYKRSFQAKGLCLVGAACQGVAFSCLPKEEESTSKVILIVASLFISYASIIDLEIFSAKERGYKETFLSRLNATVWLNAGQERKDLIAYQFSRLTLVVSRVFLLITSFYVVLRASGMESIEKETEIALIALSGILFFGGWLLDSILDLRAIERKYLGFCGK